MGMIEIREYDTILDKYTLHTKIVPGEIDFDMKILKDDTGDLCLDVYVPYIEGGTDGVRVLMDSHLSKKVFETMMSNYNMMMVICHNRYWIFTYDEILWQRFPEWIHQDRKMYEGVHISEYIKPNLIAMLAAQHAADSNCKDYTMEAGDVIGD